MSYLIDAQFNSGQGYYSRTVFEWRVGAPDECRVLASGGRYDDLAACCCGRPLFAVGVAVDLDQLWLCAQHSGDFDAGDDPHIVLRVAKSDRPQAQALEAQAVLLGQRLRRQLPSLRLRIDFPDGMEQTLPDATAWVIRLNPDNSAEVWSREQGWVRQVDFGQVVDWVAGRRHAGEVGA